MQITWKSPRDCWIGWGKVHFTIQTDISNFREMDKESRWIHLKSWSYSNQETVPQKKGGSKLNLNREIPLVIPVIPIKLIPLKNKIRFVFQENIIKEKESNIQIPEAKERTCFNQKGFWKSSQQNSQTLSNKEQHRIITLSVRKL